MDIGCCYFHGDDFFSFVGSVPFLLNNEYVQNQYVNKCRRKNLYIIYAVGYTCVVIVDIAISTLLFHRSWCRILQADETSGQRIDECGLHQLPGKLRGVAQLEKCAKRTSSSNSDSYIRKQTVTPRYKSINQQHKHANTPNSKQQVFTQLTVAVQMQGRKNSSGFSASWYMYFLRTTPGPAALPLLSLSAARPLLELSLTDDLLISATRKSTV